MRICEWNQQAWGWTGKEENPYGFQTPQSPQKKLSPDERYPRLETLSSWSRGVQGIKRYSGSQFPYCSRLILLNPSSVGAIASMN